MSLTTEYEYAPVRIPPGTDRGTAAVQLSLQAEYGGWELARTRIFRDGRHTVTLRRKIIKANRSDAMVLQT
jgi:hypothetical protein